MKLSQTVSRLLALSLLAAAFCPAGCAVVKPWERGQLSHPSMLMEARLGDGYNPHVRSIREGATGGETTVGGGCGCN